MNIYIPLTDDNVIVQFRKQFWRSMIEKLISGEYQELEEWTMDKKIVYGRN